jgi:hypothetical protein
LYTHASDDARLPALEAPLERVVDGGEVEDGALAVDRLARPRKRRGIRHAEVRGGDGTGNNSLALSGRYRPGVQLAGWLRNVIDQGAPVRLPWRILRGFEENQKLAKRLWIYLAAERWKPAGTREREGTWIACGDRLFAALGMDYGRPRDARAALKRATAPARLSCESLGARGGSTPSARAGRPGRPSAASGSASARRSARPAGVGSYGLVLSIQSTNLSRSCTQKIVSPFC